MNIEYSITIEQNYRGGHVNMKLFDSELNIMELLWRKGELTAKEIAQEMNAKVGWSKTTTYTVLKKCIEKGAVARQEPGFLCRALVSKKTVQEEETNELIQKMYGGAADQLVASILGRKNLSREEIDRLRKMVEEWD